MIEYENDCVDCDLPCFSSCKYLHYPHYYCDECGEEETLYYFENKELCIKCIQKLLEKVI